MANELNVNVRLGVALTVAVQGASSAAVGALIRLGATVDVLRARQQSAGQAAAQSMAPTLGILVAMTARYQSLGAAIGQATAQQTALAAAQARGNALKSQREDLLKQIKDTKGSAMAWAKPVVQSVKIAGDHQQRMRNIAMEGNLSPAGEAQVGASVRAASAQWNQSLEDVSAGVSRLAAGGVRSAAELSQYAPLMAKFATAIGTGMQDIGGAALAMRDSLGISASGIDGAMNVMAEAGRRGSFGTADMVKAVPSFAPIYQQMGTTGKEAVAEIGAALQVARKGAGSNEDASKNFQSFMESMNSADTMKNFESIGIDMKASMVQLRSQGLTPVQAVMGTLTAYMGTKGPAAAADLQKALAIKDDKEREAAVRQLADTHAIGDLFKDKRAMDFVIPAIAHGKEMKDIQRGASGAAGSKQLDDDAARRLDTFKGQVGLLDKALTDVGLSIGSALLPPLTDMVRAVVPVVRAFADWARENPGIIKGVVGLVATLYAGRMAILGVRLAVNLLLTPFAALRTAAAAMSLRWSALRALWQSGGGLSSATGGLRSLGGALANAGRQALGFARGAATAAMGAIARLGGVLGTGLRLMGSGAAWLGRVMGGALVSGLRMAAQAVMFLGRMLVMNPIGMAVAGVAGAAYLVWDHWDTVKSAFTAAWAWLKDMGSQFMAVGGELIDSLVSGITSRVGAVRDTIVNLAGSVTDWFKSALGGNAAAGVTLAVSAVGAAAGQGPAAPVPGQSAALVQAAAGQPGKGAAPAGLQAARAPGAAVAGAQGAAGAMPEAPGAPGAQPSAALARSRQLQAAQAAGAKGAPANAPARAGGGGIVVHYAPTINVPAGDSARASVTDALKMTLPELERMIQRVAAQQQRRSI